MAITGQIAAWINLVILDAITLNNNVTLAILKEKNMAILNNRTRPRSYEKHFLEKKTAILNNRTRPRSYEKH